MVFQLSWELFLKDVAIRTVFTPSIYIYILNNNYFSPSRCCFFCLSCLKEDLTPGHPFTSPSSSFLEEEEALPFSSAGGNSLKLHLGESGLDWRKNFLLEKVVRLWISPAAQGMVESPSLEWFRKYMDVALGDRVSAGSTVGFDDLRGLFQPP